MRAGAFWNAPGQGTGGAGGAQAEAARIPLADGTLVKVPGMGDGAGDESLYAGLLTLSDVYGTGWHAAVRAGVTAGDTVAVIGDGAVGLLAVLSAKQLGAERIILMGRHRARTDLGREFGATAWPPSLTAPSSRAGSSTASSLRTRRRPDTRR